MFFYILLPLGNIGFKDLSTCLYVAVVHPFSLLYSIPFLFLYHILFWCNRYLDCFHVYGHLCTYFVALVWMELLGFRVYIPSTLPDNAKQFSKQLYGFTHLPAVMRVSIALHP